ncbi:MAG TPA: gas vesicle protein [Marmoricola sp.]|nr:gas vesicle protein [Marmoricola sp.]
MTEVQTTARAQSDLSGAEQISLVDLLDRLLGTGVVLSGDIVISLAGVDLVQVRLHALICTIREDMAPPGGWTSRD